jgi:dTDP-4-amino-4,6-dideoxygalactose transaminase
MSWSTDVHADHPDREWLASIATGISAWLDEKVSTPTSQLTGGGAIARGEQQLSARHGGRPAILLPSATYALWVALRVLGVRAGDEVLIPQYDWTSSLAVVLGLGARPLVVPTDPTTLTIDPAAAAGLRTAKTRAVIATHLFGIPADIPALQLALPGVSIVEDCAQAFGSTLDGRPVGSLGDAAVFSFGPGKRIDVGELGALLLRDQHLHERALMESAHPVRQQISGVASLQLSNLSIRPHPLAAVLLNVALDRDDSKSLVESRQRMGERLALDTDLPLIGVDSRRGVATATIPVLADMAAAAVLRADFAASHGEVLDIESVNSGAPIALPLVFLGGAHHMAEGC